MKDILRDKVAIVGGKITDSCLEIISFLLDHHVTVFVPVQHIEQLRRIKAVGQKHTTGQLLVELTDCGSDEKMADMVQNCSEELGCIAIAIYMLEDHSDQRTILELNQDQWDSLLEFNLSRFFVFSNVVLKHMKSTASGFFLSVCSLSTGEVLPSLDKMIEKARIEMIAQLAREVRVHHINYYHLDDCIFGTSAFAIQDFGNRLFTLFNKRPLFEFNK